MKPPAHHTREVLGRISARYCSGRLLDIGAGRAKYLPIFEPYITEYVALDNCSSAVQFEKQAYHNAVHVIADALALPFDAASFDTVCSIKLLEHVADPFLAFREMARVMKPGGYCIVSSDWLTPYHAEPKHYWHFSADGYAALGEHAGLALVESIQQGGTLCALWYIIVRTAELQGGRIGKKVLQRLDPVLMMMERCLAWCDRALPTSDGIGHVVIFRKP